MDKILIASCFTGGPNDEQWAKLQTEFLNKTVTEHSITKLAILRCDPNPNTEIYEKLGYITLQQPGRKHAEGVNFLLDYFKDSEYDYLCLLDSDAWPIVPDWIQRCVKWIEQPSDNMNERCGVAAVRIENLDTFPHPCVFFVNRNFIKKPKQYYSIKESRKNLLGNNVVDLFSKLDLNFFYPLLRTNKINYHPIGAAVYHNTFYHHVAGSRRFTSRSLEQKYYSYYQDTFSTPDHLTSMLMEDPDKFIKSLMY